MPPAKKPAARRTTRASTSSKATAPITRKEVEAAVARFDKALDDAHKALTKTRTDLGTSARGAYNDVARALRTVQRESQKATRAVIKDVEKLRASATAKASTARAGRSSTAKAPARNAAKTTAAKTTAAKTTAAKTTAAKPRARAAAKPRARTTAKAPASTATKRTSSRTASK